MAGIDNDERVILVQGFDQMEFGRRVSFLRKIAKLTQAQLAEKIGLSVATINNIETGIRGTTPENVLLLAQALGTTTDYLLAASSESEPDPEKAKRSARITAVLNECSITNDEYDSLEAILMLCLQSMKKI